MTGSDSGGLFDLSYRRYETEHAAQIRERERDTHTHTHTHTHTETQTDRQIDRQTETQTDRLRQTDRQTDGRPELPRLHEESERKSRHEATERGMEVLYQRQRGNR